MFHYSPLLAGPNAWALILWAGLFGVSAADLTARTVVLGRADELAARFRSTASNMDALRDSLDPRLGVDWIVPLKAGMDITADAWKLAEVDKRPWSTWKPPPKVPPPEPPQRPERIRKAEKKRQATVLAKKKERQEREGLVPEPELVRVELKVIPQMRLWTTCSVPVNVVLMREHMSDGTCSRWVGAA